MSVILPGSYDPPTVGHLEIIKEAARREGEVYAVIFVNPNKKCRFSLEDRASMLMLLTEGLDNVMVSYSTGRVVDYMREHGIERIIKGYRNDQDLEWERVQAEYNLKHGGYETELIKCKEQFANISSTLVRDRLERGEDISDLVPKAVLDYIQGAKFSDTGDNNRKEIIDNERKN